MDIAVRTDSVIRLDHRPGHFHRGGPDAGDGLAGRGRRSGRIGPLQGAHVRPVRTGHLMQDPVFAIGTNWWRSPSGRCHRPSTGAPSLALTCIDWLAAGLSQASGRALDEGVYRDRFGRVRLIESDPSYARMVNRAFDKIRQAARGMPAVAIRMLDSLTSIMEQTVSVEQRRTLARQAEMILHSAEETVPDANDRHDIALRYQRVMNRLLDEDPVNT